MPSVRDMLAGETPDPSQPSLQQEQRPDETRHDITDRLRQSAQLRVELARQEVETRQDAIIKIEARLGEISAQHLPKEEILADLQQASMRLNEARGNLARAEEAQLNTELAASTKIAETSMAQTPAAKPSVREQLKSYLAKAGLSGPSKSAGAAKVK